MDKASITVEQAAYQLQLHPKTVLRYIREGRLPATRIGKSYRIARAGLDAFSGSTTDQSEVAAGVRTTCIVDIPELSAESAERLAIFLQAACGARPSDSPPMHLQTAFDPLAKSMKVVIISSPANVAGLLQMLQAQVNNNV
jgi:excisionase family DNA binding protein